jgi:phosphate transport system substrate-binding protein
MQWFKNTFLVLLSAILFFACTDNAKKLPPDTLSSGTIDISADETYKPIIDEEIKVFDSSFPEAHIHVHYKPEAECIKDFMNDKARLILVTRDLSADEKKVLEQKKIVTTSLAVAKDAVAVIVNNNCEDSVLSVSQLTGILTGTYKKKYTVVFDNQGSSTLRYMMDSILHGEKLATNVFAAKGQDSVIAYVTKNPDAIGFAGVSAISDFSDPEGLAFIKNVKIAAVFNDSTGKVYKPYQAYIAPNWYPLTRKLYFIHRETYPGLGTGFSNFLMKERGQLIFKQARLFPLRSNIIFREAAVNP